MINKAHLPLDQWERRKENGEFRVPLSPYIVDREAGLRPCILALLDFGVMLNDIV
jgi:hypothetical protein